jgi:DinB superfamily
MKSHAYKGNHMDPTISAISSLFHTNDQLFHRALDGIDREHLLQRPHDGSNPLIWIAGHATTSRGSLTKMLGESVENPWSELFKRGATIDSSVSYPEIQEIVSLWEDATEKLMTRLKALTDEELAQPATFPVPAGDKTQRGAIVFLNYHETYHIGQMAYLRKWLGHSQLVG